MLFEIQKYDYKQKEEYINIVTMNFEMVWQSNSRDCEQ